MPFWSLSLKVFQSWMRVVIPIERDVAKLRFTKVYPVIPLALNGTLFTTGDCHFGWVNPHLILQPPNPKGWNFTWHLQTAPRLRRGSHRLWAKLIGWWSLNGWNNETITCRYGLSNGCLWWSIYKLQTFMDIPYLRWFAVGCIAISPFSPDMYLQQYVQPSDGQGTSFSDKPVYNQLQWNVIAHMETLCIVPYIIESSTTVVNWHSLRPFLIWTGQMELILLLYQENYLASKSPITLLTAETDHTSKTVFDHCFGIFIQCQTG